MPEDENIRIETSITTLQVPEGGKNSFNVRLSSRPRKRFASVSVRRISGDMDIRSATAKLTFSRANYNRWQSVTLTAAEDGDTGNGAAIFRLSGNDLRSATVTAVESDNDQAAPDFQIMTDFSSITVEVGSTAVFKVKLSANPGKTVTVTTGFQSGDTDLSVASGATLTFTASNWNGYQSVTLKAAADQDTVNGQATFALAAAGAPAVYVTAIEREAAGTAGRVVIDPVSRIEGHLRVEVAVSGGKITEAWSTATLFRGIETILNGRDPRDAPIITQRLCGVCTYVHQLCSVRAIENAMGLVVPDNARLVRNLTLGAQFAHDHIVHFYNLHGLDWVDITKALTADPAATARLAAAASPDAPSIDFAAVKTRLQGLVNTGNLGPFANAYWGHTEYTLTAEENLLLTAHYLSALDIQLTAARMMSILGGKNPHPQSSIVGGVTCGGELTADRLQTFRTYLDQTCRFVETVYLPDLKLMAARYPAWKSHGGFNNFLAVGEFPQRGAESDLFMPAGVILNGRLFDVQPLDESSISEHVARSWYAGTTDRHPLAGETQPAYTGLSMEDRYSWFKAPRYDGAAMEVGPLARVLVGYGLGDPNFLSAVMNFLDGTDLNEDDLLSTLGRTAARGIETSMIAAAMVNWLGELETRLTSGNKDIYTDYVLSTGKGRGLLEAPRGALGHWIDYANGAIVRYQMVVPTTWNLGPRCAGNIPGALEQALVGVPVANPDNPLEVLRVIHSFDPCVACGVHVIDTDTNLAYEVKAI